MSSNLSARLYIVAFSLLAGMAPAVFGQSSGVGTVSGRIVVEDSLAARVEGGMVMIRFEHQVADDAISLTELPVFLADGAYEIDLPAGRYRASMNAVVISPSGEARDLTVFWPNAFRYENGLPFDVIPDTITAGIDFVIGNPVRSEAEVSLSGSITDANGLPVKGAFVEVATTFQRYVERAGTDGLYKLVVSVPTPGGRMVVRANAEGYAPARQVIEVDTSLADRYQADFILEKVSGISGTVFVGSDSTRFNPRRGHGVVVAMPATNDDSTSVILPVFEAPIGERGGFKLEVPAGSYRLMVLAGLESPDGSSYQEIVWFYGDVEDESQSPLVTVINSEVTRGIDFTLPDMFAPRTVRITGRVEDAAGVGLDSVFVGVPAYNENGMEVPGRGVWSDERGGFALDIAAPAYHKDVEVVFRKRGFVPARERVTLLREDSLVTLDAMVLHRASMITGRVSLDDASKDLSREGYEAYVFIQSADSLRGDSASIPTDIGFRWERVDSTYALAVREGSYLVGVFVAHPELSGPYGYGGGYTEFFDDAIDAMDATIVEAIAGDTARNIDFGIPDLLKGFEVTVQGVVSNTDGGAVVGAEVHLWTDRGQDYVITDSLGAYAVTIKASNRVGLYVGVRAEGYMDADAKMSLRALSDTTVALNFILERATVIGGQITWADTGEPVSGIDSSSFSIGPEVFVWLSISAVDGADGRGRHGHYVATPDSDGNWRATVPAGSYLVELDAVSFDFLTGAFSEYQRFYEDALDRRDARPITVEAGSVVDTLDMAIPRFMDRPEVTLSGQVVDAGGQAIPEVTVYALAPYTLEPLALTTTDISGQFEVTVAHPSGMVLLMAAHSAFDQTFFPSAPSHFKAEPVFLYSGVDEALDIMMIEPANETGFSLSGQLVDAASGAPVVLATAMLKSMSDRGYQVAYTDTAGFYQFSFLDAGTYGLHFHAEGYKPKFAGGGVSWRPELALDLTNDLFLIDSLAAVGSHGARGMDMAMAPESVGMMEGRVIASTGEPVENAVVEVMLSTNEQEAYYTLSDDEGSFALEGVSTGSYTVTISAPGFETTQMTADFTGGEIMGAGEIVLPVDMTTTNREEGFIPSLFDVSHYPNPTSGNVWFEISLPEAAAVRVAVYDLLGRQIDIVAHDVLPSGRHVLDWNASTSPAGMYLYQVETSRGVKTGSLTVVR